MLLKARTFFSAKIYQGLVPLQLFLQGSPKVVRGRSVKDDFRGYPTIGMRQMNYESSRIFEKPF